MPIIFVSYHSDELIYASFIARLFDRRYTGKIKVFVAKRDIPSGADPSKTMLVENLLHADAVIPICSKKSALSGWVWWESASVWTRGKSVHPLFLGIDAREFGDPMKLLCQGRNYFEISELEEVLVETARNCGIAPSGEPLTADEIRELKALKESLYPPTCKVNISYKPLEETQHRHIYQLNLSVENVSTKKFESLHIQFWFPYGAIETKELSYDWLQLKQCPRPLDQYGEYVFNFDALPDGGKRQFSIDLLPGRTLNVFGHPKAIYNFRYVVDTLGFQDLEAKWEVFVDGILASRGSKKFEELNRF